MLVMSKRRVILETHAAIDRWLKLVVQCPLVWLILLRGQTMTNKYLLFNVWDAPYRNVTIWYCFAEDEHCETRETDWQPIYDGDPRFTILKSLSGWLEASTEYYSFKRYAITTEEYEAIVGVTS